MLEQSLVHLLDLAIINMVNIEPQSGHRTRLEPPERRDRLGSTCWGSVPRPRTWGPRHFRHFVTSLKFADLRDFDGNLRMFVTLACF
jgi:hypothetical protein